METGAAISIAELRKSLECPVCMETPRTGPLYQCQNGHIICSVCIKNIQECPQCRVKLPVSRIRCLLGEQQLERLPKKCKYSDNGCDFEQMMGTQTNVQMLSRKKDFNDHENECPHRNIMCFYGTNCDKNVPLSKLLLHLKDVHKEEPLEVKNSRNGNMNISTGTLKNAKTWVSWSSTLFKLDGGKQFYSQCFRNATSGLFFLWVYMIGTPKEEENYIYTYTVYNAHKTESQSCKRKVISIDTPWKTICSEKSIRAGLIIPDDVIKSFGGSLGDAANEKVALSYSITIESVKNNSTKTIESVKNNSTKRKHIEIE